MPRKFDQDQARSALLEETTRRIETPAAGARPGVPAGADKAPTRQDIELAAYLRWQDNGGDAVSNWLAAESDLKNGVKNGAKKKSSNGRAPRSS